MAPALALVHGGASNALLRAERVGNCATWITDIALVLLCLYRDVSLRGHSGMVVTYRTVKNILDGGFELHAIPATRPPRAGAFLRGPDTFRPATLSAA